MDFDLVKIVEGSRETFSHYHLYMARGWQLIGEEKMLHTPLAYSAFEFRCAIERCLIELFVLIKNRKISPTDRKAMERFNSLVSAILSSEGGKRVLSRKMIFLKI